eukprot:2488604-Ditylum_brightwellii.AAC.1
MSTCCHGICSYQHYVGRDYLKHGLTNVNLRQEEEEDDEAFRFGKEEFDWMKCWSSGSSMNCSTSFSKKEQDTKTSPSTAANRNSNSKDIEENREEDDEEHVSNTTENDQDPYS